jgi:CRISPR type III-B/RAMP module RAMP protein Cmr6
MPSNKKRKGKYGTGAGKDLPPAQRARSAERTPGPSDVTPPPPRQERRGAAPAVLESATQSVPTAIRAELPTLAGDAQRNAYFELYSAACYRASKASSEATTEHFNRICQIRMGDAYRRAYNRWKQTWEAAGAQLEKLLFSGEPPKTALERPAADDKKKLRSSNRLLIGLSNPSLWESGITLNPTYGTPVIPGSACKGLARHFAESHLHVVGNTDGLTRELSDCLFGKADDAGEVCFHDAWWVPDSAPASYVYGKDSPFVREVVTPHHKKFLDSAGDVEATPFDSPVPIPQIAAHGCFLFVVTGSPVWAEHALDILRLAISMEGVGARTPEYGRADSARGPGEDR